MCSFARPSQGKRHEEPCLAVGHIEKKGDRLVCQRTSTARPPLEAPSRHHVKPFRKRWKSWLPSFLAWLDLHRCAACTRGLSCSAEGEGLLTLVGNLLPEKFRRQVEVPHRGKSEQVLLCPPIHMQGRIECLARGVAEGSISAEVRSDEHPLTRCTHQALALACAQKVTHDGNHGALPQDFDAVSKPRGQDAKRRGRPRRLTKLPVVVADPQVPHGCDSKPSGQAFVGIMCDAVGPSRHTPSSTVRAAVCGHIQLGLQVVRVM
mmetsp:Transcript_85510/g.275876  ORF Transcript_85510/g.275876 Transcript_85510/m.275876 type:complete len:263 (+) Transcript_85510:531-1319(+)